LGNPRVLLYAALGFLLLQIWMSWQIDYGPKPVDRTVEDETMQPLNIDQSASTAEQATPGDLPVPAVSDSNTQALAPVPAAQGGETASTARTIKVETDTYLIDISTVGGDISGVKLRLYPTSINAPDDPFVLMSSDPDHYFVAQSGLQSVANDAPTHHAEYQSETDRYVLGDGQDELRVPMVWQGENGQRVTKTYVFNRDSYHIKLEYQIENGSSQPWTVNQYRQLRRKPVTDDEQQAFIYTFIGGVMSTDETRYKKIKFEKFDEPDFTKKVLGGWVAIIEHYFVGSWIPQQGETNTFYTKALSSPQRYLIGMQSQPITIAAGSTGELKTSLFVGPKLQDRMREVAPHLDLTVDYGFLSFLAKPIFWLLQKIHGLLGNWGWAIVGVTFVIKLIFYKLSEASYRSMARMRKLQPQLQALKERYGDDRAKMGQATMDLYKKEKVNPLGGCLPILIQIPVFISLYWVLLESVELRQAPWILWIKDLSLMDKFYVLPLIMGVTMFIQQKLNPAPVDPIQAKVFMAMPIIFTFFFAFFPAGLVLYWVSNNTLSIAQQYYITRHVLAEK